MSIISQLAGFGFIALVAVDFCTAQSLTPVFQFSGNQMQVTGPMTILTNGKILVSGTSSGETTWLEHGSLQHGGLDVFLACYDPESEDMEWVLGGGSAEDDGVASIATDAWDNTLISGFSFGQFSMGNLELEGTLSFNPKLLYMVKISPFGEVLDGWVIQGTEEFAITDVTSDYQGNWIICGHFKGDLILPDTTLLSESQSDLFLVKYDPQGNMLWAIREGLTGITRPLALSVDDEGDIICGGIFDRTTSLAGQELEASSNDRDLFLVKYNGLGTGIWSRKAGGVQDDDLVDLKVNALGDIFVAGYFRGVLSLGSGISMQTNNGDPDFFLLKYDNEGIPQAGISFGGTGINQARDIFVSDHQILFSGLFQGTLSFGGLFWDSGPLFAGFFGFFDHNLAFIQGYSGSASEGLFPSAGILDLAGNAWLGISFAGSSQFGGFPVESTGDFDGLLLKVLTTSGIPEQEIRGTWRIYPNPVLDRIHVEGWQAGDNFQVLDLNGRKVRSFGYDQQITMDNLPQGIYFIHCRRAGIRETIRLIKQVP